MFYFPDKITIGPAEEVCRAADMNILQTLFGGIVNRYMFANFTVQNHFLSVLFTVQSNPSVVRKLYDDK